MAITLALSGPAHAICTPTTGCNTDTTGTVYTWQTQSFATMADVAAFVSTLDPQCQASMKVVPQLVISTETLGTKKAPVTAIKGVSETYEAAYCVATGGSVAE